jgi:hypothetical protein
VCEFNSNILKKLENTGYFSSNFLESAVKNGNTVLYAQKLFY